MIVTFGRFAAAAGRAVVMFFGATGVVVRNPYRATWQGGPVQRATWCGGATIRATWRGTT